MTQLDTTQAAETPLIRPMTPTGASRPAQPDPAQPHPAEPRSALPTEPRAYHHFLRTPRAAWWRGVLAILTLIVAFLVVSFVLGGLAVAADIATGRTRLADYASGDVAISPMLFLANNLSLAAMLPVSMLLQWAFFGQRPRWLSSVEGGFRWRWFGRAALLVVPLWLTYAAALALVQPLEVSRLSADAVIMLVIILLTTPLQAAGEEYGARGLIARAAGSWSADPRIALVLALGVANLIFMVAHAATDPWLIAYYFVFGVALGIVAWRTGGLEAPVLIHVVNNVVFLVPAALFGDLSEAFDRGPGAGGPWVLLPMAAMTVAVLVVEWWSRRNRIVRITAPAPEVTHA
jgi:membrane protease YdiL (CAAX protease family)